MTKNLTHAKLQYRIVVEINAPIGRCFAATTAESAMMHWVPGIKDVVYDHTNAAEPYGAGSQRLVTVALGKSLIEIITESIKPDFLCYRVPNFGLPVDVFVKDYGGRMSFKAIGRSRTQFTWEGYFRCPHLIRLTEPLFGKLLGGMATKMANNIKRYVESKAY